MFVITTVTSDLLDFFQYLFALALLILLIIVYYYYYHAWQVILCCLVFVADTNDRYYLLAQEVKCVHVMPVICLV